MEEFTEKHAAALEFLVGRFESEPFTLEKAANFMHRSILQDLINFQVLEKIKDSESVLYRINYELYLETFQKRTQGPGSTSGGL